jgi:ADP-heptose:LPS heptosyltransferase
VAVRDGRPTLLMLRALGLGDLLTAVPALRALSEAFPCHRRVLATSPQLSRLALAARLADAVVPTAPLQPLGAEVNAPAIAVNLHGSGPQSHRILLATRPTRLIAFAHPAVAGPFPCPAWRTGEHEVARWCRLLSESGLRADPSRLAIELPPRPVPADALGATIIHPGAHSVARRWPAERWAAIAASERRTGRPVVLTGDFAERALAMKIAQLAGLPTSVVCAGRTDVLALAALVQRAGRVVCGDTGIAHVATALGTPSVVLFGPTPPAEWGPPVDRPWHRVLWKGGRGDPHGTRPDTRLLAITIDDVLAALADLPPAPPTPAAPAFRDQLPQRMRPSASMRGLPRAHVHRFARDEAHW